MTRVARVHVLVYLIGTFCIVNLNNKKIFVNYNNDLIGTFCIVNKKWAVRFERRVLDLIGTFCIVNNNQSLNCIIVY